MSRRTEAAQDQAPEAPPCFNSRLEWHEYVGAAAFDQQADSPDGPLKPSKHRSIPLEFEPTFNFCTDCTAGYKQTMVEAGRCQPLHVMQCFGIGPSSGCIGKTRFSKEQEARQNVFAAGKRGMLTAYLCTQCDHWHVGTAAPKVPGRRAKKRLAAREPA